MNFILHLFQLVFSISTRLVLILFFTCGVALAEDTPLPSVVSSPATFESSFSNGINAYEKKQYEEAIGFFNQALVLQPENLNLIVNLALAEFQSGKKYLSLAHLRKVLSKSPQFQTARVAYLYILKKNPIHEVPREISLYDNIRENLLILYSEHLFLFFSALSLFLAGYFWTRYLRISKKANEEESTPPPIPILGILSTLSFLLLLGLSILKFHDLNQSRGTLVEDTIPVYSAPDEKTVKLGELYGGLEVLINSDSRIIPLPSSNTDSNPNPNSHPNSNTNAWTQITYPGSLSGWIKSSQIMKYE